jgi:hypothetical protein
MTGRNVAEEAARVASSALAGPRPGRSAGRAARAERERDAIHRRHAPGGSRAVARAAALCALVASWGACAGDGDPGATFQDDAGAGAAGSDATGGGGSGPVDPLVDAGGAPDAGGVADASAAGCFGSTGEPVDEPHFTILDPGTGSCSFAGSDGSGRVRDDATGLVWNRYPRFAAAGMTQAQAAAYCEADGARLPTLDEATSISGPRYDSCVFPCGYSTWTTTSIGVEAYVAWMSGASLAAVSGIVDYVLCVR